MNMRNSRDKGGFIGKMKKKLSPAERRQKRQKPAAIDQATPSENLEIIEEYESIKQQPAGPITGWDFDRAFRFLEKYPDSPYAEKLKEEMYGTNSSTLKGLSYESAVKVVAEMPDHPGIPSIISGMRKLECEYIKELKSDVIAVMLELIPDHPLMAELTEALAVKNLTNAYDFIERNPRHPCTRLVIQAMFSRDPNIAILLLHERMDHPQVGAIFEGIYAIPKGSVKKLMPDAILFILDVAADHPHVEVMLKSLVSKNYVKAFDFIKRNPESPVTPRIKEMVAAGYPELLPLLEKGQEG